MLLVVILYTSCEEEISIDVPGTTEKLVVNGHIENGQPPYVELTRSAQFFGELGLNDLEQYYIHGAIITVYSATDSVQLTEYSTDDIANIEDEPTRQQLALTFNIPVLDPKILQGFTRLYFYTIPFGSNFVGNIGETYQLKIVLNGKTYTSTTTIPNVLVSFDSLWKEPADIDELRENYSLARGKLKDPIEAGTYYRYTTRTPYQPWLKSFQSVFDDAFINGDSINTFIPKGLEVFEILQDQNDLDAKTGYWDNSDTCIIKLSVIDKAHYEFWRTLENNRQNQGSPFGSTVKIKGNIIGKDVIGVWGGYSTTINTLLP